MTSPIDWSKPPEEPVEHEFSTGRRALLRTVGFRALFRQGDLSQEQWDVFLAALTDDGPPPDPEIAREVEDVVVCASFVEPRLAVPDEDGNVPDGFIPITWLADGEIVETVQFAIGAVVAATAATFRSLALSAGVGEGGAPVRDEAEPDAGPRGRVKGGAARRPPAGRAAPGA